MKSVQMWDADMPVYANEALTGFSTFIHVVEAKDLIYCGLTVWLK